LRVVLEVAVFSFWLSRLAAIARLARLYRIPLTRDVSPRVSRVRAVAPARV
jgi:hypothetical protein